MATTFVNTRQCSEYILLDLKYLLKEAKQLVPHFLEAIDDPMEKLAEMAGKSGTTGCAYCGGLGHRVTECPAMRKAAVAAAREQRDYCGARGGMGAEM